MSTTRDTSTTEPAVPASIVSDMGRVIADAIRDSAPKRVTVGQYDPQSPFHPDKKTQAKLKVTCVKNGMVLNHATLHDAEVRLINQLKSGRYINRLVEVILRPAEPGEMPVVEIRYKWATMNDRLAVRAHWSSFKDLLEKIIAEQSAGAPPKAARQGSFNSPATREARAAAGYTEDGEKVTAE